MIVCQYCGRAHCVDQPDSRFCSVLCREQHGNYWSKAADNEPNYLKWIALYSITVAKSARQLLEQTESQSPEQQLAAQRKWLANIASQESQLREWNEQIPDDSTTSRIRLDQS
ncbi:hypothetical protein [Hymenobacter sp. AT01-02]|uniref:hypothetical protein n=1 Tax=Hymenobacter sp. AT01-02 TaxID=1571877 RepID=UPI000B2DB389|nr:hypothetical protein [Hymenobacter sp. AT01-02]